MSSSSTPNDQGWEEIKITIPLTCLAALAVGLRFMARLRRANIGMDDWFALAGLVFLIGMMIELILWATIGGNGKHFQELGPTQIETFFKIFLVNEFTYSITSPLIKVSIITFYRRIFAVRQFRLAANVLIGMTVAWGFATFLSAALQCRPLAKAWDPTIPGTCFNTLQYILGVQGVNIALDFAILMLPIPMVWALNRPWQDKLALSGVFFVGAFVCGASIYRIVTLLQIATTDFSFTIYQATVWTFIEPCIGLVCGCLPIIRGLFPAYVTKKRTTYGRRTPGYMPGHAGGLSGHSAHVDSSYHKMDSLTSTSESRVQWPLNSVDSNQISVETTVEVTS